MSVGTGNQWLYDKAEQKISDERRASRAGKPLENINEKEEEEAHSEIDLQLKPDRKDSSEAERKGT